jgi:D-tyrosyl-tRNA(Tyr) deacylase
MKALIQRVASASVSVRGEVVGHIGKGFLVLLGVTHTDTAAEAVWLANKIAGLRLFEDGAGKMNLALADVKGALLVVSQFTLYGDARKGRRPSFVEAAPPPLAEPLVAQFVEHLRRSGFDVASGRFGANMQVQLTNDGPVTMMIERHARQ